MIRTATIRNLVAAAALFFSGCLEGESASISADAAMEGGSYSDGSLHPQIADTPLLWMEAPQNLKRKNREVQEAVAEAIAAKLEDRDLSVPPEAAAALLGTKRVIEGIRRRDIEAVLQELEQTIQVLSDLAAQQPQLVSAATGAVVKTHDGVFTLDQIEDARAEANQRLAEGDVLGARAIMESLVSESLIQVSSIPLGTFAQALENAVPLVEEGAYDAASASLADALRSVTVREIRIPLPLVRAGASIERAQDLAYAIQLSPYPYGHFMDSVEYIRYQLRLAHGLGYLETAELSDAEAHLRHVSSAVQAGRSPALSFDALKSLVDEARSRVAAG